jgi:hypothetical protein
VVLGYKKSESNVTRGCSPLGSQQGVRFAKFTRSYDYEPHIQRRFQGVATPCSDYYFTKVSVAFAFSWALTNGQINFGIYHSRSVTDMLTDEELLCPK